MTTTNEYIVFEADQVLTNEHLNDMFNYLDQQNRWTRNKLIGIGIACGFNIVHHTGVIDITGGCGVTSQGYLIVQKKQSYTYFISYSPVDQPNDLPFDYTGKLPFFKPFCAGKTIYQLLTDDDYNALETAKKANASTLSSQKAGFLDDYVVVLFLEATETDLKNCSAFDCTNKGEKMQFNIRALLVAKTDLNDDAVNRRILIKKKALPHQVHLKRYNVPYTNLNNSDAILNAFVKLVDDTTLTEVANAYNYCYEKYGVMLNQATNPFSTLLNDLKTERDTILRNNPILIEYFYDFIDDLINAYYEFSVKINDTIGVCCPDENLFPLHLVLGDAANDTDNFTADAWRTYFIYSPLFSNQRTVLLSEAAFLFRRMQVMTNVITPLVDKQKQDAPIKITPSQLGNYWLSQRAIPYYYYVNKSAGALYNYWNYYKTSHGNAAWNLSYNADVYNTSKAALSPLLYDIEHYNFFRIEGHIGENYTTVLSNILKQRLEYNLPFDVVAVPSVLLRTNAKLPPCNMQDLETDYKLIISEFACRVHTPFCYLTKLPYSPAEVNAAGFQEKVQLQKYSLFRVNAAENFTTVTAKTTASYAKGDFMRQYCPPADNTIGSQYLQGLTTTGVYSTDISSYDTGNADKNGIYFIYNYIFRFIDAVEELMLVLMTSTPATLNMATLKSKYTVYTDSLAQLSFLTAEIIAAQKLEAFFAALELDILVDEFFLLSSVCIDERLQTLINEYNRRLHAYMLQASFLNYFKKHPGLEHKAGVPKGGTFVLVYHEEDRSFRDGVIEGRVGNTQEVTVMAKMERISGVGTVSNTGAAQPAEVAKMNQYYYDPATIERVISFVKGCTNSPSDQHTIIGLLTQGGQSTNTNFRLTQGAVIADFYVPYLCCSDCAPVTYIFPSPPKPVIKMDTTFCDNNSTPQDITVSPAGGTITDEKGAAVKGVDEAALTFTPSVAGAGKYTLLYTAGGVASDAIKIEVLATPAKTGFSMKSDGGKDGAFSVTFTPAENNTAYKYAWEFGPGFTPSKSTDAIPVVSAKADPTVGETESYTKLTVSNGICSGPVDEQKYVITANGVYTGTVPPEKPVIKMGTQFCTSDTKAEPIVVSPAGGKITDEKGNEVKGVDSKALTFTPSVAGAGTYSLIYTANGTASAPVKVEVLATPAKTGFSMKSDGGKDGAFSVTFTPDEKNTAYHYAWEFGPGFTPSKSTDAIPVVNAKADPTVGETESYAKLTVSNGICSGPVDEQKYVITTNGVYTGTVPPEKPVIKMGTQFCVGDAKAEPIVVSPAGGTITDEKGNEVKGVDNKALTFTPSVAGAGTYMLIYTANGVASNVVTVEVLATPANNNFSMQYKFLQANQFSVMFTPEEDNATYKYAWEFGPGFKPSSSTDAKPVITAAASAAGQTETYAKLTVSNGACAGPVNERKYLITPNGVLDEQAAAKLAEETRLKNTNKPPAAPNTDTIN